MVLPDREKPDQLAGSNIMHECKCGATFELHLYVVYETMDFQDFVCPECHEEFSIYKDED